MIIKVEKDKEYCFDKIKSKRDKMGAVEVMYNNLI